MGLEKLQIKFLPGIDSTGPIDNRRYTLTHSDFSGDLFLSIGLEFDKQAISGLYTRLMRDGILAEWLKQEESFSLHVYCHVSGGIILGTAGWRYSIFKRELPLVLKCICNGDTELFDKDPNLKNSIILVHFKSKNKKYNKVERWGTPKDYLIKNES
ncbi:MAG: staygreen family protein [Candidatus Bathyarchaeota archaeon]